MPGTAEAARGLPDRPVGTIAGVARRMWSAPLWTHAVVLAGVLILAVWAGRPGVAYTSDEGAALLQARLLDDTGGWAYAYPLASIDPEDRARPFVRGDAGTKALAPYAKHPFYPLVLLVADRAAGTTGMVLTSVAGTLVAAVASALLARRFAPVLDRVALWTCGVASPLLFDAGLILAHTLAAAAAGLAALAAARVLERDRPGITPGALAGLGSAVAVAVALRSEGMFVGPALAVGALAACWARPVGLRRAAAVAATAAGATLVAAVADRAAFRTIVGEPLVTVVDPTPSSWLAGRVQGIVATWFDPSYGDDPAIAVTLVLATVLVAAAAIVVRLRPGATVVVTGALVVATAAYLVRLALDPAGAIPGLAVAFPVAWAGVWLVHRHLLDGPVPRLVSVAAALVVAGVALTQYPRGGGVEWGGRYFAIALPLAVPPLLAALRAAGERLDRRAARAALAALVTSSLLVAGSAVRAQRQVHTDTRAVLDAMRAAAAVAGDAPGLGRPVVVSWNRLLPQIAYRDFDDYDWVVPEREHLVVSLERLAALGVTRVVLVTPDSTRDLPELAGWVAIDRPPLVAPLEVVVLERRTG